MNELKCPQYYVNFMCVFVFVLFLITDGGGYMYESIYRGGWNESVANS